MAEKEKTQKDSKKAEKPVKTETAVKKRPQEEMSETLVRIMGFDIPGSRSLFSGLTRIKGISWAISNFVCLKIGIPKNTKIEKLTKDEVIKIETFLKTIDLPQYMRNRRSDPETGESSHLYGTDLEIARDFDIKRMKKMKSYKGIRHGAKLPVRGQRTRSHFRVRGQKAGSGIKKPVAKPAVVGAAK